MDDGIRRWLQKPIDYWVGFRLLKESGGSRPLIMMLETGESKFNRRKLMEALERIKPPQPKLERGGIHDEHWVDDAVKVAKEIAAAPKKSLSEIKISELESDLKLLYKKQSAAHAELKMLVRMNGFAKDRSKKCFEILDIGKEIRAIGLVIHNIRKTGSIPERVKKVHELDTGSQFRKLTNNRSYISKFSEDQEKKEELERRIMENLELERILKI